MSTRHRALHTALQYGVREERILNENVASRVKGPAPEKRERTPMNPEQIRFLIRVARDTRLEAPVGLTAVTGLRRGELLALRWQRVDLDKGSLFVAESLEHSRASSQRIRFKGPKSKTSRRVIPLAPECVALLRSYKAQQEEERLTPARRTPTMISCSRILTVNGGLRAHFRCSSRSWPNQLECKAFDFTICVTRLLQSHLRMAFRSRRCRRSWVIAHPS